MHLKFRYLLLLLVVFCISCKNNDTLFTEVSSSKSNVDFKNFLSETADFTVFKYGYFYNGGGVAAGDFNNDGLTDLYFTANLSSNKLYINKGKFEFEEVTDQAGVACRDGWNTGVSLVDINQDGWLDIYVCRSAAESQQVRQNLLFINNRNLTFTEKAAEYGLNDTGYSTQASFFDYDKDGDLDCFIVNHSVQKYAGFSNLLGQQKTQEDPTYSSRLMRNTNGKFEDISKQAGMVSNVLSFGLAVATTDLNNDGWLDLYVSNDYNEEDYLYINQQDGTFKESMQKAISHNSMFSMGSDAADINNDGWIDILTLDMQPAKNERIKMSSGDDNYDKYNMLLNSGFYEQSSRNMLHLNNGISNYNTGKIPEVSFSEIGQLAGISNTDWSWATLFGDYDLDGYKDVFITNGYARDYTNMEFLKFTMDEQIKSNTEGKTINEMEILKKMPSINEPNFIFKNNRNLGFENKQLDWGIDEATMSNGAVHVDLDNDGDLDLVVNNVNAEARIYQNNTDTKLKNKYLKIALQSNNPANMIGAKIIVYQKGNIQKQEFSPVRGFQSSIYAPLVFGLEKTNVVDSVQIIWQNDTYQTLKNIKTNSLLTLKDKNARGKYSYTISKVTPLFGPAEKLNFTHAKSSINDFKLQPLLPSMVSAIGPKLANADINNDGLADFYVCGGRGQAGKLFFGTSTGFKEMPNAAFDKDLAYQDADAAFFDVDNDKDLDLMVVSAGYELDKNNSLTQPRLYVNAGNGRFEAGKPINVSINAFAIAVFDINEDGYKDVFIGSKANFERYPMHEDACILINDGKGGFKKGDFPILNKLGNISDAILTNIDADKTQELVLTTDYGKVMTFKISNKTISKTENTLGSGMYNTVLSKDFDKDGDQDLIIGNVGSNFQPVKNTEGKLSMYFGEFNSTDRMIPILCFEENGKTYPFVARDELLDQIPELKKKYSDYVSYSKATIDDLLKEIKVKKFQKIDIAEFETQYFENKNGTFVKKKLPMQAQFSPVYAAETVDVNRDGYLDLVMGGNLSKTRVRIGQVSANHVQIYLNNKKGGFEYYTDLGVKGDVRDIKLINKHLIVSINERELLSFRIL